MLRKFLNSEIRLIDISYPDARIFLDDEEQIYVQSEKVNDNYIIVEYVKREDLCDLIQFGAMQNNGKIEPLQDDKKVEEFRAIVLRTDPFSRYSGLTLGEIIDLRDTKWVNQVVKNMTNTYIREKVEYLAKYYKII